MADDKPRVRFLLATIVDLAETIESVRFDEHQEERAAMNIVDAAEQLRSILQRHDLA